MPFGDAARIRHHVRGLVEAACLAGDTSVTLRAGEIRDALGLNYSDAIIDVCQVLETRKFRTENGVELVDKTGPRQGAGSIFRFSLL